MKPFQNILCVVDAAAKDQFSLQHAAEFAQRNSANLKIVDVIDETPSWLGKMFESHHIRELEQRYRDQLQEHVEFVRSQVPSVTAELLRGRTAITVVKEVLRHGFDLVMKDARGTSEHKNLLFGSADMRLLRICPCPVWLSVSDRGRSHGVILAAIDPLADDEDHKSMNQSILELASSMAEIENAEVHVVSAWGLHGEYMLAGRIPHERLLEFLTEKRQAADLGLTRAVSRIRPQIDSRHIHLRKGETARVILDCVNETKCDLLIMGTVARDIPGLLMGNTADSVLRQIECSVITVKPDNFVSPVKPD